MTDSTVHCALGTVNDVRSKPRALNRAVQNRAH